MRLLTALRVLLPTLAFFSAGGLPGAYGGEPAGTVEVPRLEHQKFTLPNGLQVIVREDHRLPLVAVNLWYHVGPANEGPGRTGFAHLFEHLMFAGSKHVPRGGHFAALEAAGATQMNGTTSHDRTNYYETVPSNQLELALWLESDRMGYLLDAVDQTALTTQQDVVRNERRQSYENQPYGIVQEAIVHQLYPKGHPYYGNVIGSHADIQAVKLEDVKAFFKRYYAPSNASLAIVGDVNAAQARKLVEKYFGSLKGAAPVPRPKAETPRITAERRLVVKDRVELPRVYMAWLTSALFKPGDADADVTAMLLGGGRTSRLYKKLVYERQIAQDVTAFQQSLMLGSQFQIVATARPGHTLEELEKAIDEELETLRRNGPDAQELERARNTLLTATIQSIEPIGGSGGVADRLNFYNYHAGHPDYLRQDFARYRAVTAATVQAFARDQLRTSSRVVAQAVRGEPDPGPPLPDPQPVKAAPGQGAESVNADEPWRKEPPPPSASHPLRLPTPETAQLSNGLKLILIQRPGLPLVAANLVFRTGSDINPSDLPGLANFTVAMLKEGTQSRNALQIADELAQLGSALAVVSGKDASAVATSALKNNFGAALGLLADVVLRPAFPAAEIERQRLARLASLQQARDDPGSVAARTTSRVLYGDAHPYGYSEIGTEASVKAMTRDRMTAFWQKNFVPNNAALVVAGDISMRELRPLVDKVFSGWQRGTPTTPSFAAPVTTNARLVIVDRPGAPQTELRVTSIAAARSSPDYFPLEVMNTALGGQFTSRINLNLREAHGYTYGANSGFVFRKSPGPFLVASGVRTDVTAPATAEIFKELTAIAETPMPPDELKRAKDALSYSLAGNFETSGGVAGTYSELYTYDLGLDYYTHYAERVNAVTADQALAAARKYLVRDRMIVIAVGDRAKIEPELRKLNLGPVEIRDADGAVIP